MDHYKIGVMIMLKDGMSPVLSHISAQLLGVHKTVKDIESGMGRWKVAILGAAAVAGGTGLLGALMHVADKGGEIVHQMEMMKILGLSQKEIAEATAKAYQVSMSTPQTTIAENLKHLSELRYAFGHMHEASEYIEAVSRSSAILNSVKGGGNDQVWSLVKALEEKGVTTNPAEFMKYVDLMTKAVIGSGGRVTPESFFSTFKYGRLATLGWSDEFVGSTLPRLIQSMASGGGGGSGTGGPGNALMSAFAKIVQGQMPKKAAEEFRHLGLTTSFKDVVGGDTAMANIVGSDLFVKNPYEWVQQILMPGLAKAGITQENAIITEISRLAPNRTASQMLGMMALQGRYRLGEQSPFEKDAAINRQAWGLKDAYSEINKNDPNAVIRAFTQQWTNMVEAIGKALNPAYLAGMRTLTSVFQSVTTFSQDHALALEVIAKGLVVLGVALVGAGAAAIIAAIGVGGWIVAGIAALGAAVMMVPWQSIWTGLGNGLAAIGRAFQAVASTASAAVDAVTRLVGAIGRFLFGGVGGNPDTSLKPVPNAPPSGGYGGHKPPVGKQGYNAVPPAGGGNRHASVGDVYLDGRKVGEIVSQHQAAAANGPLNGSAYFDPSAAFMPADFSYARG